jgi:ribonuclease P protein component
MAPHLLAFPPAARLHTGRDYGRVFYQQQKAGGRWAVLLLAPRSRKGARRARLGIMVNAKTGRTAVRRHQLKRWVREWFRTAAQERLAGHDAVVLFRADPPEDAHAAVVEELERLLPKALAAQPQPGSGKGPRKGRGQGGGSGGGKGGPKGGKAPASAPAPERAGPAAS